ncbi:Control catabolite protein of gluconeogenesis [Clostridioides difficile]|nr:Control catabolite protein of gluconeogenesis [Clostridioides difficile]
MIGILDARPKVGYIYSGKSSSGMLHDYITEIKANAIMIGVIMTRMPNIICGNKNDNAYDLAKKIIEHEIDSIPIVESLEKIGDKEQFKIIGKVSKTNVTKLFVKLGKQ